MRITTRERQVIERVAKGLTDREIAVELELSPGTVKQYMHGLRRKHPHLNRYSWIQIVLIEHARTQAYQLNQWLMKWAKELPGEARHELLNLIAQQIASVLRDGQRERDAHEREPAD